MRLSAEPKRSAARATVPMVRESWNPGDELEAARRCALISGQVVGAWGVAAAAAAVDPAAFEVAALDGVSPSAAGCSGAAGASSATSVFKAASSACLVMTTMLMRRLI